MAALKPEVKAFIIQALACFDTLAMVAEAVQKEFGIKVTHQHVESHDPTKVSGKGLAKKWVELFTVTRERFQTEIANIPIANKSYRLRALDRMAAATEKQKNFGMTAQLMEQAAKEVGDAYSNKHKFEHTGKDGGPIESAALTKDEYKLARQEMLEDDDC
ncbi:TPA: DUF2280 domain-containing protein [Yersinia enterocolitica]|uniref:DUF2280 domain-containing protein n=1 Tax=Yersinia enterocolitica TaxID=630 RepID=UPI00330B351D|nr:DUF2280 domain-containing protein [Yersinia enterocolitica]